ncbi:MAG TPA: S-layer glycoprotein N-glycosyltransferase AglJ [Methanosarcinales archaeon]|nr:S-layer glycoprotein N-glycosyltransferase AglJ [Methanosarcinales archaeon]
MQPDEVCIFIPTMNESHTIGDLVEEFTSLGFTNILVLDGNSKDGTADIAREKGANVVMQTDKGKGQAVMQAFDIIDSPYVIMIDGDGTYLPGEVNLIIDALAEGAGHVIGDRFANPGKGAFSRLNKIGNKILNKLFGFAYGEWLNDILSGYRGFTRETISNMVLNQTGFEIETEITVECVRQEVDIRVVPITYLARAQGAPTKLNPLTDGFRIGGTIFKMAKINNPLFYFSVMGSVTILIGLVIGTYVVMEWMAGITHVLLAVLTTLIIISGIQMFIFAIMGDLIASLHKETMRALRKQK